MPASDKMFSFFRWGLRGDSCYTIHMEAAGGRACVNCLYGSKREISRVISSNMTCFIAVQHKDLNIFLRLTRGSKSRVSNRVIDKYASIRIRTLSQP